MGPFGKDQNAVAAINRLSGKRKALAEASLVRKRKNIEQRDAQEPFHPIKHSHKQIATRRRSAKSFKGFSPSRSRQLMTQAEGKRGENKAYVNVSDVIAHHQRGAVQPAQVLSSLNARPAQQENSRTQQEIVNQKANPADRPTLRTGGVVIDDPRDRAAFQHTVQVADRACG